MKSKVVVGRAQSRARERAGSLLRSMTVTLCVLLAAEATALGREISVAVIGGDQGNRATAQAFMAGDLSGNIDRLDVATYNSTPAGNLRFVYDVLVFAWAGDPAVDIDWQTRILPFLRLGGGVVFEDSSNVADLAPGVVGTEVNSSRSVRVITAVAGLTDGVVNDPGGFVDWHMAFTAWDSRLLPFLRSDDLTVGLYGEIEGGRIVLTGPDQEYHGQRGAAGAQGNQYGLLLNEIAWVARLGAESGCLPGGCEPDSFKCYRARRAGRPAEKGAGEGAQETAEVSILDRFGIHSARLLRPFSLCNVTSKNGLPTQDAEAQLLCYRMQDTNPDPRQNSTSMLPQTLEVQNEFGSQAVRLTRSDVLCVAARATESDLARQSADPMQCYKTSAQDSISAPVILNDQFGTALTRVSKPIATCLGATLARDAIEAPAGRALQCRRITGENGTEKLVPRSFEVVTSFGTEVLLVTRPHALCVPSLVKEGP